MFTDRCVQFRLTRWAEIPYEAFVDGQHWLIRLNDFLAEPIYTLVINGIEVQDLESWPAAWQCPADV